MPEGPSIVLAKEAIRFLKGKVVADARGTTTEVDYDRVIGKKITAIKTWGKHLLICFPKYTIRIHLMMFGTYAVDEPKPKRVIKLGLNFKDGHALYFYACSIGTFEESPGKLYDWSADVLNSKWDQAKALKKARKHADALVCDILLDQKIFSGVGNIIKNEVLFRTKVHPESKVGQIPAARLRAIAKESVAYSKDFLKWKREGALKKHWQAYTKKQCPRDKSRLVKSYPGKTRRRTYCCETCQEYYG